MQGRNDKNICWMLTSRKKWYSNKFRWPSSQTTWNLVAYSIYSVAETREKAPGFSKGKWALWGGFPLPPSPIVSSLWATEDSSPQDIATKNTIVEEDNGKSPHEEPLFFRKLGAFTPVSNCQKTIGKIPETELQVLFIYTSGALRDGSPLLSMRWFRDHA